MDLLFVINQYLLPGIILGSIYTLGAIGITLIFGILRFAHLAHGDIATLGAFIGLFFIQQAGLTPLQALPLTMVMMAFIALLIHRVFYAYLSSSPTIVTVMASLGVALMVRSLVQVFWGTDPIVYVKGIQIAQDYGGLRLKDREIVTIVTAVALVIGLQLFLNLSKWGKAMRATSDNADLAELSGIDTNRVIALTWLLAGALCAAAGVLLGWNTELRSMMGWHLLLPMFAAAVVGGVGRVDGAILGGMLIGLCESLSVIWIRDEYKSAVAFVILLLVLSLRPQGVLKGKVL